MVSVRKRNLEMMENLRNELGEEETRKVLIKRDRYPATSAIC